jgi:hypothetical protein
VAPSEAEALLAQNPDWRLVDDQLASARAVLGREDVRVIHVDDFTELVNDPEKMAAAVAEIRHAIYRPSTPGEGTLHEFSVFENGRWVPVEVRIRDAEMDFYNTFTPEQKADWQRAFENVLRAKAGYGPVEPPADGGGGTPPGGPTPPADGGGFSGGLRVAVVEYGLPLATTATLASTVPAQYLALANGVGWIVRGATTGVMTRWPEATAADTRLGKALRFINAATFVANGSYHGWTLTNGVGAPWNQLYAVSDHTSLVQNVHEGLNGTANQPPRAVKLTGMTAANLANAALLVGYSIPAGPLAWVPNLLFGGGTAYLTYGAVTGRAGPTATRVATTAISAGLVAFGLHYVLTKALPELREPPPEDKEALTRGGDLRDGPPEPIVVPTIDPDSAPVPRPTYTPPVEFGAGR